MNTDVTTAAQTIDAVGMQNIFQAAPATLNLNTESMEKARAAGRALLKNADETGMNDNLDGQMSMFAARAKKTVETMNERRKPFTQLISMVQKKFTSLEKEVSEIAQEVQDKRDAYATQKIGERKERERVEREKLEKERNTIQLRKNIETKISNGFVADLTTAKKLLFDKFNSATIDDIEGTRKEIASFAEEYAYSAPEFKGENHAFQYGGSQFSMSEIAAITGECVLKLAGGFKSEFKAEISALKRELIDKLPSKLRELQELAKSDAEARGRIESERIEREKREAERIEREAEEAKAKAAETAELRAAAETINAIAESEVLTETRPQVKEGYEIEVLKSGGWLMIVQFWYEKEGKDLDGGKIAKFTLERMKRFCEAYALKHEEKIVSPLIEYKPIYKAK
jgi:hypothetical protein